MLAYSKVVVVVSQYILPRLPAPAKQNWKVFLRIYQRRRHFRGFCRLRLDETDWRPFCFSGKR